MMNANRNMKLGRLHQLAKEQALDEDAYRDKLQLITGKRSAKELSDDELDTAITAFTTSHVKQNANFPHTAKVKALWIALWNLAAIESGTDAALDAFVERQTGRQRLSFLTPADANSVTEALKAIGERNGFVVPKDDAGGIKARQALLVAQWAKLTELGQTSVPGEWGLDGWISHKFIPCRGTHRNANAEQADKAARALGNWLRRTKAKKAKAA